MERRGKAKGEEYAGKNGRPGNLIAGLFVIFVVVPLGLLLVYFAAVNERSLNEEETAGYTQAVSVLKIQKAFITKIEEAVKQAEAEALPHFYKIDESSLPEGIHDFVEKSRWLGFYDCESEESVIDSAMMILNPGLCFDPAQFRDYLNEPQYGTVIFDEREVGYYSYDEEGMDRIFRNVYNVNDEILEKVKSLYLDDFGKYRWYEAGVGAPDITDTITRAQTDGTLYQIEVVEKPVNPEEMQYEETFYVVLEYKTDGNLKYWSIYRISHEPVYEFVD